MQTAIVLLTSELYQNPRYFMHDRCTDESSRIPFCVVSSSNLVKFPSLRTPFTADLERPTHIRTKVVIATALAGLVEPRAGRIDCSNVAEICRLGCGWCGAKTMMVRCGVFTTNWKRDASLEVEKKWWMPYGQAASDAFIACKAKLSTHFFHSFPIKSVSKLCFRRLMALFYQA